MGFEFTIDRFVNAHAYVFCFYFVRFSIFKLISNLASDVFAKIFNPISNIIFDKNDKFRK